MENPKIIYEDKDLLIINKPSGMLVHGTYRGNHDNNNDTVRSSVDKFTSSHGHGDSYGSIQTVVDWLLKNYPEIKNVGDDPIYRPGIVHRLDRETSGILVVAKNQSAFEYLKKQFQEHRIQKTYLALAWGLVKNTDGTVEKPIGLKPNTVKRTVFTRTAKMIKEAITNYHLLQLFKSSSALDDYINKDLTENLESKARNKKNIEYSFSLLEVAPLTGRTHQIRVHLSSIGHPVVGDSLYASKKPNVFGRLFLHAESIEFKSPSGEHLKISVELPKNFQEKLERLREVSNI